LLIIANQIGQMNNNYNNHDDNDYYSNNCAEDIVVDEGNDILMFNEEGANSLETQLISPILTEEYLHRLTGEEDLALISSIQLSINTESQSIANLFTLLPNLTQLSFNNSFISSLRDFNSSSQSVTQLNLNFCGLHSLDCIANYLPQLIQLNLSGNQCSQELSHLLELKQLRILDISANNIHNYDELDWLNELKSLRHLILTRNPISYHKYYRPIIANKLSQLRSLDAKKFNSEERMKLSSDQIEAIIEKNDKIGLELEEISYANVTAEQTETYNRLKPIELENANNSSSGASSNSNSRPSTGNNQRPATAAGRAAAAITARPSTANKLMRSEENNKNNCAGVNDFVEQLEASSSLTYGAENGIIAGNITKALRNRRKLQSAASNNTQLPESSNTSKNQNTNQNDNIDVSIPVISSVLRRNSQVSEGKSMNSPVRAVHSFSHTNKSCSGDGESKMNPMLSSSSTFPAPPPLSPSPALLSKNSYRHKQLFNQNPEEAVLFKINPSSPNPRPQNTRTNRTLSSTH
jgi:hypothetical protein